ncbi:Transcriptional regulator, LuxR family [Streptomyces formicae]|uniref:Transcriptional regulator, LuxR family n=2 Tax=Streptomyces formicae TaxID=1616117 RepID=A0A291Q184_9ACTN|nr:Transcriptional regulator, LuxR family [Streptomyces formicae]
MACMSAHDYQRVLDLTVAILNSRQSTLPWELVRAELGDVLDSSAKVLFASRGWPDTPVPCPPPSAPVDPRMRALDQSLHEHPLVRHYRRTGDRSPLTDRQARGAPSWPDEAARHTFEEAFEADHQMTLPLPAPPGASHLIVLGRQGELYGERDLEVARRVQPLLAAVVDHMSHASRLLPPVPGEGPEDTLDRAADYGLTPRETVVLTLLAQSLTADTIGRRLGISPRTAHKHLENVYRKLGTADRLATVLHARDVGLLPGV